MQTIEQLGRELATWLWAANLWTLPMLLAAVILDRLLTRGVRPAWRALLFASVLLRLAIPFEWTRFTGLADETVLPLASVLPPTTDAVAKGDSLVAGAGLSWGVVFIVAYILVALALTSVWLRGRLSLQRVVREARAVGDDRAPSRVPLMTHPSWGPGVIGTLRPRIVVPDALVEAVPGRLHWILRHERAHLRRGDVVTLPLLQLATFVMWGVLPLWAAMVCYRRLVEMACDEIALRGTEPTQRKQYGELLLAMVETRGFSRWMEVSMTQSLTGRLRELRHVTRWNRIIQGSIPTLVVIGLLLFVGPGVVGQAPEASPSTKSESKPTTETPQIVCPPPASGGPGCVAALTKYDESNDELGLVRISANENKITILGVTESPSAAANMLAAMAHCPAMKPIQLKAFSRVPPKVYKFEMAGICDTGQ